MEQTNSCMEAQLTIFMHTWVELNFWFFLIGKKKERKKSTRFFPVAALGWDVTNLLFHFIIILS